MNEMPATGIDWVGLTRDQLPIEAVHGWATIPECGAVVLFTGVVRDHAEGRDGVVALTYEAYEERAEERLAAVAAEARQRWPVVGRVALVHRIGEVPLGQPTVVVAVSAPHRAEAFEAARFAIDTLKETVPVWKLEHGADGSSWSSAAHDVRPIGDRR